MKKQKQIIINGLIIVIFLLAVLLSYNLGSAHGKSNNHSQGNTKAENHLEAPSIRYEYKIYQFLTDVEDVPEGYTVNGQVSSADDHAVCRAGDDIYVSDNNPYCIYTKQHIGTGGNRYNLFVTAPLCYYLVMYNGSVYESKSDSRIEREMFNEADYKCIGQVKNIDCTSLPSKEFDSNIKGADKIFSDETDEAIFVKIIESDEYHYIKLSKRK